MEINFPKSSSSEPVALLLRKAEKAFLEGETHTGAIFLDKVRSQPQLSADRWGECARLNEILGRHEEALADYDRALKLDPKKAVFRLRRARILLELNRRSEAKLEVKAALLAGLNAAQVQEVLGSLLRIAAPPPEPEPAELDRAFYDSRGRRKAIERFLELFRGRPGAYARQWFDPKEGKSGYYPVLEPLTPEVVEAHLQGKITVGVYLLDPEARVYFSALDLDLGKEAIAEVKEDLSKGRQMASAMKGLMAGIQKVSEQMGLPVVFERSGYKGVHAWYFFDGPVPAWAAKAVLTRIQEAVHPPPLGIRLELFPKQVALSGKGYGNLIKLPLGVHRVTGKKSVFLDEKGGVVPDSLDYLLRIKTAPSELVISIAEKVSAGARGQVIPFAAMSKPKPVTEEPAGSPFKALDKKTKQAYGRLLEGCSMVRYLVRKAREFKHLSFDERKIVLGVIGHLPGGQELVHHVISRCADYDPQITGHFITRMPRAPLGCKAIRRRLFYLQLSQCKCKFEVHGRAYATPLLHVLPNEARSLDRFPQKPAGG